MSPTADLREVCQVILRRGVGLTGSHWVLEAQMMTTAGTIPVARCPYSSDSDIALLQAGKKGFQQARQKIVDRLLQEGWELIPGNSGDALSLPSFQRRVSGGLQARGARSGTGIVLKRVTQRRVNCTAYELLVDGSPMSTIVNGATVEIPLAPGPHDLQMKYSRAAKSDLTTVQLNEGEYLELSCGEAPTRMYWGKPFIRAADGSPLYAGDKGRPFNA